MSANAPEIGAPERISANHLTADFSSGRGSLDNWLKRRALSNNERTSRTFVICIGQTVVGYYSLSAGSVALAEAPSPLRRNSVDPIPVILLGRLAIDEKYKGKGLGAGLLRDAVLRSIGVAQEIGVRALLVHALDEEAAAFYRRYGFANSPISPLILMLPLDRAAALL